MESSDFTKIRQCRLGINRRGLLSLNVIPRSMFKLLSTSEDFKFKHPFSCLVSGISGCGKSSFSIRFLKNLEALCSERKFDGGVIWCYSEKTAVPNQQLAVLKKKIRYNEGVSADFENAHGRPCLIILDDL